MKSIIQLTCEVLMTIENFKFNRLFYIQHMSDNNHGLYVHAAQYADAGVYECIAETILGSVHSSATLVVTGNWYALRKSASCR